MSHLPSLDPRGGVPARRGLIGFYEGIAGYGMFSAGMRILDLFGKGEAAVDIYKYIPHIQLLTHPLTAIFAIVIGFYGLIQQTKSLQLRTPIPVSQLVHPITKLPVSSRVRLWPVIKRPVLTCVIAAALAFVVWSCCRGPWSRFFFITRLSPVEKLEMDAPDISYTSASANKTSTAQRIVATPGITVRMGTPASNAPIILPQPETSAYEEVGEALGHLVDLDSQWHQSLQGLQAQYKTHYLAPGTNAVVQMRTDLQNQYVAAVALSNQDFNNRWATLLPLVSKAFSDALKIMSNPGKKQLSPNEKEVETKQFGASVDKAAKSLEVSEIQADALHEDRFDSIVQYLRTLRARLGDYPESGTPH